MVAMDATHSFVMYHIVLYYFDEYNILTDYITFRHYIMSHINSSKKEKNVKSWEINNAKGLMRMNFPYRVVVTPSFTIYCIVLYYIILLYYYDEYNIKINYNLYISLLIIR